MTTPRRPRNSNPSNNRTPGNEPTPLPTYQPPSHPLNPTAQQALHELPRTHNLTGLTNHLSQAINSLTAAAGDINDRSQQKLATHQKRKARRLARDGAAGAEDHENERRDEGDRAVEDMRVAVDEMTGELEQRVRKIVDAKAAVANVVVALRELDSNLSNGRGVGASTQSTLGASQFRGKGRGKGKGRRGNVDLSDEEEEEEEEDDNDNDGNEQTGLLKALKRKTTDFHSEYETSSMQHRYASNNDYIGFKKILHDARNPQHDAPPLPHSSTWFPSSTSPVPHPHTTTTTAPDEEEDLDLEIASERISITCPLTLQPMREPVSSTVCPHSFERAAILEMISRSAIKQRVVGGNGVEQHMKCPVSGCDALLSPSLLKPDPILLRKIKRRLLAAAASPSPSPSPSPPPSPSAPPPPPPHSSAPAKKVKDERRSVKREVSMIPATQLDGASDSGGRGELGRGTQIVDLEDEE